MADVADTIKTLLVNEVYILLEKILRYRGASLNNLVNLIVKYLELSDERKESIKDKVRNTVLKCLLRGELKIENGRYFINRDDYSTVLSNKNNETSSLGNKKFAKNNQRWSKSSVSERVVKKPKRERKQKKRRMIRGVNLRDLLRQLLDSNYKNEDYPDLRIRILSKPAHKRKLQITSTEVYTLGVARISYSSKKFTTFDNRIIISEIISDE